MRIYGYFFNNLIVKDNKALLIRVEPSGEIIDAQTDSIWYSRGNLYPYGFEDDEFDEEIFDEDFFNEEDSLSNNENDDLPIANEDPNEKNYFELRDSVQLELQQALLINLLDELLVNKVNLTSSDLRFQDQLTHECEATFYFDNSRGLDQTNSLWYFQTVMPSLYKDIKELYTGNIILGDLYLKDQSIEFVVEARYGEKLGSIYQEMND